MRYVRKMYNSTDQLSMKQNKHNTVSKNRFISRSFKTNLKFTQIVNDQYIHRVISEMNCDHLDTKIILLSSNIMNYEILNVPEGVLDHQQIMMKGSENVNQEITLK